MTDRLKNISIGGFIALSLIFVITIVLFLKPTIGSCHHLLKVRFTNITGVNKGTRVVYAGKPVGDVCSIEEVPNARLCPDESGKIFSFQLTLRVDGNIEVFTTDEISIRTTGLMGERFIAIQPKPPGVDQNLQSARNEILYANPVDALDNTLTHLSRTSAKAEQSFAHFDDWFQQTAPILFSSTARLTEATQALISFMNEIKDLHLAGSITNSVNHISDVLCQIRDEHLITNLSSLFKQADTSFSLLNNEGSLSHLLKGEDLYLRLSSLLSKSETLMNDINHYGLLFQYNKQWQKARTKKIHLLNALETPQDFRTYFEGEIDCITTSLGRIGALLERAEEDTERQKIIRSDSFKKDFAILLRQVHALDESLKLYNQDLLFKEEEEHLPYTQRD